jgi:hypothetical protein
MPTCSAGRRYEHTSPRLAWSHSALEGRESSAFRPHGRFGSLRFGERLVGNELIVQGWLYTSVVSDPLKLHLAPSLCCLWYASHCAGQFEGVYTSTTVLVT